MIRSMAKECSNWDISCIDISTEDIQGAAEKRERIVQQVIEEPGHPLGEEIALRAGKRYVRTIHPYVLPNGKETPFRHQGVYLILGGAGGIGLELSHYLAKTVQARLVLIGRSELKEWQRKKIKEIESVGGIVKYIRADVLELESMKRAVAETKGAFGNIHGVIHSAIVLKDKTLQNMDEKTFRSSLDPKVKGSAVLYEAVRGEKLDFMMFFSSAQSFMGNLGQSNYAAACTFKDAYANFLNQRSEYPVKVVNWGYWGSVGIVSNDEYNKRMERHGIQSIEPSEGMEVIRRLLNNNGIDQIIPIKAEEGLLQILGFNTKYKENRRMEVSKQSNSIMLHNELNSEEKKITAFNDYVSDETLETKTKEYIKMVLSNVLKIDGDNIDEESTFEIYGVDSVMSLEIKREFEKDFGKLSSTLLFENTNIKSLSEYFIAKHPKTLGKVLNMDSSMHDEKINIPKIIILQ
ncbi:beta-ketoacyl reductase [Priestia megaterium]